MKIRYDVKKMKKILSSLSVLMGISMSFIDNDRKVLCLCLKDNDFCSALQSDINNKNRCNCSDSFIFNKCLESKCFVNHVCYAGLFDAAFPIMKDNVFAGMIIMGRLRLSGNSKTPLLSKDMQEKYEALPEITDEQIAALEILLPNVLFESAIFIDNDGIFNEIIEYINENLQKTISIEHICKKFHVSKNNLYAYFSENYGKTVNEFISDLKIEKSKQLLLNTEDPIYLISENIGLVNHTYFCKLFKKKTGLTPSEFRKAN